MTDLRQTSRVVAEDLRRAEQSINAAARDTTQFLLTMLDGTAAHGISPAFVQPSVKAAIAAISAIVDGQQQLTHRAHPHLQRVGGQLGLTVVDWGEGYPKPALASDETLATGVESHVAA